MSIRNHLGKTILCSASIVPHTSCYITLIILGMVIDHLVFSNKHFNTEESKGQVGSIETEADALEACCDLHETGPSKVSLS
jgi:hypothetical protein